MGKSEKAFLRRWHLKPDLWIRRTKARYFR